MEDFIDRLNQSELVTVIPTGSCNFWDYDSLLNNMCRDLSDQVEINHIFSCGSNDPLMTTLEMRWSNLPEHGTVIHKLPKVRARRFKGWEEVRVDLESKIKIAKCDGLNPYKAVEIFLKYHPTVQPEYHENEIYAKPTAEQWSKVKVEKADWSDFHRA
jgi:hypothetical protein